MDWIHCNKCCIQTSKSQEVIYFFSSCGHILCQTCLKQESSDKCMVCSCKCNFIELNKDNFNKLPRVKAFFTPPQELLKSNMTQLQQVLEFQQQHRMKLIKSQQIKQSKFEIILENYERIQKEKQFLERDNRKMKQIIEKLTNYTKQLQELLKKKEISLQQYSPCGLGTYSPVSPSYNTSIVDLGMKSQATTTNSVTHGRITLVKTPPIIKKSSPAILNQQTSLPKNISSCLKTVSAHISYSASSPIQKQFPISPFSFS